MDAKVRQKTLRMLSNGVYVLTARSEARYGAAEVFLPDPCKLHNDQRRTVCGGQDRCAHIGQPARARRVPD